MGACAVTRSHATKKPLSTIAGAEMTHAGHEGDRFTPLEGKMSTSWRLPDVQMKYGIAAHHFKEPRKTKYFVYRDSKHIDGKEAAWQHLSTSQKVLDYVRTKVRHSQLGCAPNPHLFPCRDTDCDSVPRALLVARRRTSATAARRPLPMRHRRRRTHRR